MYSMYAPGKWRHVEGGVVVAAERIRTCLYKNLKRRKTHE